MEAAIGRLFLKSTSKAGGNPLARRDLIDLQTGVLVASEQWCREQDIIAAANQAVLRKRAKMQAGLESKVDKIKSDDDLVVDESKI